MSDLMFIVCLILSAQKFTQNYNRALCKTIPTLALLFFRRIERHNTILLKVTIFRDNFLDDAFVSCFTHICLHTKTLQNICGNKHTKKQNNSNFTPEQVDFLCSFYRHRRCCCCFPCHLLYSLACLVVLFCMYKLFIHDKFDAYYLFEYAIYEHY